MSWTIGVSTGCCREHGVLDVLSAVHAAGIDAVELGTPPNHFNPADGTAVRHVAERLRMLGIRPVSIHAPFGGGIELSSADPRERQAALGRIATSAAALRHLGGSIVVVHPTDIPRQDADVERRLDLCAEALSAAASICKAMGLVLALESPLPHLIGGAADEFTWLVGRLDDSAGVCLDTGHATLGNQWDRLLGIAGSRLIHVHANDHRGRFDDHLPPGDGSIDWRHISHTLRAADFSGFMMLELNCQPGSHAAHFARAFEQARRVMGEGQG